MGQRAIRPGLATALPAARSVDGAGGAGGKFFAGDSFGDRDSSRYISSRVWHAGIGEFHARGRTDGSRFRGIRGHISEYCFCAESAARDVQSVARATSRWEYGDYSFHERGNRDAVFELVALAGIRDDRTAARLVHLRQIIPLYFPVCAGRALSGFALGLSFTVGPVLKFGFFFQLRTGSADGTFVSRYFSALAGKSWFWNIIPLEDLAPLLFFATAESEMNPRTTGRAGGRNGYRVEVSGWDAKECFFVEKSTLAWTEMAGKTVALTALVRSGRVIFVRLIQPLGGGNGFPVPYRAVKLETEREGRRSVITLEQLQPRTAFRETTKVASERARRVRGNGRDRNEGRGDGVLIWESQCRLETLSPFPGAESKLLHATNRETSAPRNR